MHMRECTHERANPAATGPALSHSTYVACDYNAAIIDLRQRLQNLLGLLL